MHEGARRATEAGTSQGYGDLANGLAQKDHREEGIDVDCVDDPMQGARDGLFIAHHIPGGPISCALCHREPALRRAKCGAKLCRVGPQATA